MHDVFCRRQGELGNARKVRGQGPLFLTHSFIRRKADTGPEGGIPQIAPAEHALVTAASTEPERFTRNSGHTVTSGCVHAVSATAENDAGSAAPVTPS